MSDEINEDDNTSQRIIEMSLNLSEKNELINNLKTQLTSLVSNEQFKHSERNLQDLMVFVELLKALGKSTSRNKALSQIVYLLFQRQSNE